MSVTNAELKDIKSLGGKKGRKQQCRYAAEGVRLLEEALRHDCAPEVVFVASGLLSERGQSLAKKFASRGVRVEQVSARQIDSMTATKTPQGILAVFAVPEANLAQLWRPECRRILLCDSVADPGNLGTLLRSALGFGFEPVALAGVCADPYSPKVVRASMGAVFGLGIAQTGAEEAVQLARRSNVRIVVTDANAPEDLDVSAARSSDVRVMLAVGSETDGVSAAVKENCDAEVRIGHSDRIESLNAAVAGSIAMKQIYDAMQ